MTGIKLPNSLTKSHSMGCCRRLVLAFGITPCYSPQLDPAKYLIHEVRRKGLYNVPCTVPVQEKAERIQNQLARGSPMTDLQMRKLLDFIARSKVKRF
ncbi:MAG: hypothetical protein Q7T96_07340 [Methylobacter sp.]|nr:hypothetical protein [Methylobacter sp.]